MINSKKILIISLTILLLMLLSAGCWDNRDVTELSLITGVGIDRTDDDKFELTVQIAKPSELNGGGASNGGGGGEKNAVWVYSATGSTIFEAERNTLTSTNNKIYLSDIEILVIGENLAREGLLDILDFWERDPESNLTAQVVIAKEQTAKTILNAKSEKESIPSSHIKETIETNAKALGTSKETRLFDLLRSIHHPGKQAAVTVIDFKERLDLSEPPKIKDMKIEGIAVFKQDELVGYLTPQEAKYWYLFENKAVNCIINAPHSFNPDKQVAFELKKSTGIKDVTLNDGKPNLSLDLDVEGNFGEIQGFLDINDPQAMDQIEQELEDVIAERIRQSVHSAQDLQADIFGFGDVVYRKYTAEWKNIKSDWNNLFSQAPLEVKVNVKIRRSGFFKYGTILQ